MKIPKSIAALALAMLILGVAAQKAQAQTYTSCSDVPTGQQIQGNVSVEQTSGDCTFNGSVSASGSLTIKVDAGGLTAQALTSGSAEDLQITASGNILTGAITAGGSFGATSTAGSVTISGAVNAGVAGLAGNILIQSFGNFHAESTVSTLDGGIEIDANTGTTTSTAFSIGTSSSNGLDQTISASSGVFIVNGNASSTGGITIANGSDITVSSSNPRNGVIWLNAQNGALKLTSGTISVNASGATQQAQSIVLLANTVSTGDGTMLTASQSSTAPASSQAVDIAAQTLSIAGSSGLTIHADGTGGGPQDGPGEVTLNPQGYLSITSNKELDSLEWTATAGAGTQQAAVTVNGGPLTITSNGTDDQVQIAGYPLKFTNKSVSIESEGNQQNLISLGYNINKGQLGLQFNTTGVFTLDASGATSGANGGTINIVADQFSTSASGFSMHADGIGANALAGQINFQVTAATFSNTTSTTITTNGVGGASNIFVSTGSGALGMNSPTFTISASGGTSPNPGGTIKIFSAQFSSSAKTFTMHADGVGTGAAGTIQFLPTAATFSNTTSTTLTTNGAGSTSSTNLLFSPGSVTINSPTFTVSANALSNRNENAGSVSFTPSSLTLSGSTVASVTANGPSLTSSTGNGGSVSFEIFSTTNALQLGTGAGNISFSATGGGKGGNGGSLTVNFGLGTINFATAGATNVSVPGTTGNGGSISVVAAGLTFTGTGYALNAKSGSSQGQGGSISIMYSTSANLSIGTGAGATQITATGQGSGKGGSVMVSGPGNLTVTGTNIDVSAGTSGDGGSISLSAGTVTQSGSITAQGGSAGGDGGQISISQTGGFNALSVGNVDASALGSSGTGGGITITTTGSGQPIVVTGILNANSPSGQAGTVTLTGEVPIATNATIQINSGAAVNANGSTGRSITFQPSSKGVLNVSSSGTISASGTNGTVTLNNTQGGVNLSFNTLTGALTVDGTSFASIVGTSNSPTTLTVKNLSASNGDVGFSGNNTNFTVLDSGQSNGAIVASGNVSVTAASITLSDGNSPSTDFMQAGGNVTLSTPSSSNGNISIGSFISDTSSGAVSITANGTGNVQTKTTAYVAGSTLTIQAQTGSIGSSTTPFATRVGTLTASTTNPGAGAITVSNTDTGSGLLLQSAQSGGSYSVTTTGTMTLGGEITAGGATSGISLSLNAGSGATSNLVFGSNLTANNGSLALTAGHVIQSTASEFVTANGGNISLTAGQNVTLNQCPPPPTGIKGDNGTLPNNQVPCRNIAIANPSWQSGGVIFWPSTLADMTTGVGTKFDIAVEGTGITVSFNANAPGGISMHGGETFTAN
jgi:hypothetical protein